MQVDILVCRQRGRERFEMGNDEKEGKRMVKANLGKGKNETDIKLIQITYRCPVWDVSMQVEFSEHNLWSKTLRG